LAWTIDYADTARRSLRKLDRQTAKRIADFLDRRIALSENPRQIGDALAGKLTGYWKYRVGDYRIICDIQDQRVTVLVLEIGNRRDVYR
jgi:mRNA interferase RelE/StbE